MARKHDYVWRALYDSLECMATSPMNIQGRLHLAASSFLHKLQPERFPGELKEKFEELMASLTSVEPVGNEGSFRATTSAMDDDTAVAVAEKMAWLFCAIDSASREI